MARIRHRRYASWLPAILPLMVLFALLVGLFVVPGTPPVDSRTSSRQDGLAPAATGATRALSAAGRGRLTRPAGDSRQAAAGPAASPVVLPRPSLSVAPPSRLTGYRWPLPNARITLPFGPSPWGELRVDGQLFHDGVDMATSCGDRVAAAHDGVVLAAGRHFDDYLGWLGDLTAYYARLDKLGLWDDLPIVVVVDDGNGYWSVYAHFSDTVVRAGQRVRAGELLGHEGATGHATGCHLHYGLFSPLDTAGFELDPSLAKQLCLPGAEIARVDPLAVLPYRPEVEEMRRWPDR